MAGSHGEKVLAAEWLAIMVIEWGDALENSSGGSLLLPSPQRFFATMIVFLSLAAVAMFGERPAHFAAVFGGVAMVGMALAPSKKGGKPVVLTFLDYLARLTGGTVQANPSNTLPIGAGASPVILPSGQRATGATTP